MGKARGRREVERRLVEMSVPVDEDQRWYPDLDSVAEEYQINMPVLEVGRIVGRQVLNGNGRLIEFSLTAQIQLPDGTWSDVVRVDSRHAEVHIHYYSCTGRQRGRDVLSIIRSIDDVGRGYELAETLIIVKWEEHERGWLHG